MDRALKERIVGAIVLVALAVLIVPVFLDGPETEATVVTERIPLPGQEDQPVKTIILDRDRDEPVPTAAVVTSEETSAETADEVVAVRDEPEREPPPAVADPVEVQAETETTEQDDTPRPSPAQAIQESVDSATGMWAVQLGSFSSKDNADRLAADLRRQGFAAFLSETSGPSGQLHRVRVGPQKDRPTAEAMLGRLQDAGQKGQVVPHP